MRQDDLNYMGVLLMFKRLPDSVCGQDLWFVATEVSFFFYSIFVCWNNELEDKYECSQILNLD